jgi:hypothetical protein
MMGVVLVCFLGTSRAAAGPISGAIYTTNASGTTVNQNQYHFRQDVYINGGPQNAHSHGLPDGIYFFQVTDSSGHHLLSTDDAIDRQLKVIGGHIAGALGTVPAPHANGTFNPANHSTPVQLFPFDFTPNPGGVYKVWLIAETQHTSIDHADKRILHFNQSDAKTDDFTINYVGNDTPPHHNPEPASAVLLGLGMAGIALQRYRSRRSLSKR